MTNLETQPSETVLSPGEPCIDVELIEPREVPLGGIRAMTVYRTIPQRKRSFIGAWCFLDHYGPDDVSETGGMSVPRHPHTGLATVSWLFTGQIDHLDSGGTAAAVVPGELNLMIAGSGITHQEISSADTKTLHGVQLWYALPDATRHSENQFVHYVPEPVVQDGWTARVFIGELAGSQAPVDTRTPDMVGAELIIDAGTTVRLKVRQDFEYGVLAENSAITVNGLSVSHRSLVYAPTGSDTIEITAGDIETRALLLGGVPLGEEIVMWWNFIARNHDEILEYRRRYQAEMGFEDPHPLDEGKPKLFGDYPEGQPKPLPAPPAPIARLKPRK